MAGCYDSKSIRWGGAAAAAAAAIGRAAAAATWAAAAVIGQQQQQQQGQERQELQHLEGGHDVLEDEEGGWVIWDSEVSF